jgi:hypothetical protein
MPLSRRENGRWPPNRFRWVKPQYQMGRRQLKQAWTLGFIPYGHERLWRWNRTGRSDRCRGRQWFHPLSPAPSREGGTRGKPHRPVIGSEPAWQTGPETSGKQSNVRLQVDR